MGKAFDSEGNVIEIDMLVEYKGELSTVMNVIKKGNGYSVVLETLNPVSDYDHESVPARKVTILGEQ